MGRKNYYYIHFYIYTGKEIGEEKGMIFKGIMTLANDLFNNEGCHYFLIQDSKDYLQNLNKIFLLDT